MTEQVPLQRAHVGVIVPAVNRTCEEQFHRHAPPSLGIHMMRARIAGKWAAPVAQLENEISHVTEVLAECAPDLMVYNCTASSMKEGPEGERRILDIMEKAAGIPSISTSAAVSDAFRTMGIKSVVVLTPYPNNDDILFYLDKIGVKVINNVALNLNTARYGAVTPQEWTELAAKHDSKDADAIFFSCAATTQIDAVEPTEKSLDKPVVNSNQAVLWSVLKTLSGKLGSYDVPKTGSLMKTLAH
jgi:maleate cis-trans isomerase